MKLHVMGAIALLLTTTTMTQAAWTGEDIAKEYTQQGYTRIEVKLSPEESKHGAHPDEVPALIEAIRACPNLSLRGLMTMPPWTDEAEPSRPYFAKLREIGGAHGLGEYSMGMSHDFEVAIEEGATHIRVGTALFGRRKRA